MYALVMVTNEAEHTFLRVLGVGEEIEMERLAFDLDVNLDPGLLMRVVPVNTAIEDWMIVEPVEGVTLNGEQVHR